MPAQIADEPNGPWCTRAQVLQWPWFAALETVDAALLDQLCWVASVWLWRATGRQFSGPGQTIVRPVGPIVTSPSSAFRFGMSGQSASSWFDSRIGSFGWPMPWGRNEYAFEILLGHTPVRSVDQVVQDGLILPTTAYRLDDARWLVRIDGQTWPCFVAGTLVLTETGLKPIESIVAGERVLTHKNRWRTVRRASKTGDSETVTLAGRGGAVRCTPDHRFWSAEVSEGRNYRKLGAPEWTAADEMVGHAWSTPQSVPPLPIPLPTSGPLSENFWWIVGRWVGDGWTSGDESGQVVLCCGDHEADEVRQELAASGWTWRESGGASTCARFRLTDHALRSWLREHFGTAATTKTIPAWLLGAPTSAREAFLAGYVSADGWHQDNPTRGQPFTQVKTVSRSLATGLRLLLATLGHAAMIYEGKQTTNVILGNEVDSKDYYRIDWPTVKAGGPYSRAWADGEHVWGRVKSTTLNELIVPVYDLEVDEDHSFVADGVVVHNCWQDWTHDSAPGAGGDQTSTMQVTLTWGESPPYDGIYAASVLAGELGLAAAAAGECRLPRNVQSVTRQGTSMLMMDPSVLLQGGLFGIPEVDQFIRFTNPAHLQQPATMTSPDIPRAIRRAGTMPGS